MTLSDTVMVESGSSPLQIQESAVECGYEPCPTTSCP